MLGSYLMDLMGKKKYEKLMEAGWELAYEKPLRKEEVVFIRVKSMSG